MFHRMKTIQGKVVILGAHGVGKTTVIYRHMKQKFSRYLSPTIGASFFSCIIRLEEAEVKLQVWDTAGQERFRSMAPMYYRNANAALLVFDLTDYTSFEQIKSWVMELKSNVDESMVLVLIGNKSDLCNQRVVGCAEGGQYADSIGASYFETSAVNDDGGVDQVFYTIALALKKLSSGMNEDSKNDTLAIPNGLRIYDSPESGISGQPASPSSEDSFTNGSIAHGITEKTYMCC